MLRGFVAFVLASGLCCSVVSITLSPAGSSKLRNQSPPSADAFVAQLVRSNVEYMSQAEYSSDADIARASDIDIASVDAGTGCYKVGANWVHRGDLNFIHIPRTAGTVIEYCGKFFPATKPQWGSLNKDIKGLKEAGGGAKCYGHHVPPARLVEDEPDSPYARQGNGASNFCVVRNPYERLISQFGFAMAFYNRRKTMSCTAESMNAYLLHELTVVRTGKRYIADCHFTPQALFVYGYDEKAGKAKRDEQWCKEILHFEHLSKDFNSLMARFGYNVRIDPPPPKKEDFHALMGSQPKCRELSIADLSPEVRALAEEIYQEDFELFQYPVYNSQVSLNALPSSIPEKIPVWILYDYPAGSEETFINLNVKALRRHADPSRFVINLVNSTNIRQFIPDLPAQYDRLPDHGARSDLIRAALMSHHGGVYLDADVLVTRDLTWITDKLADHDFVSYTVGGQNCSNGIFSSNVIAGRKGNRLSADWWADIQRSLVQRCSFEEKRDLENGVCCYDPQGKSRKCHIPWGGLGEKTGHPALQRLQKGEQAFKIFCYDEIDNEGFAPDPAGKLLFRELVKQATSCKAGDTGTKTGTHVMFTSPCPCWELHGKPADEPTLECADGTTGKNIFNRGAYHMFAHINGNIAGSASEQEILTGRWIVSSLYRTALGLPPQA